MCSNWRLSREDFWTVRRNLGGRRTSASSSKGARLWGARRPPYHPNGSGAGSDGNTNATQRVRGDQQIYLAGIDDAHHFRVDNIETAALQIPYGEFSILLSYTPEIYRQAAHADFNLLLSGHTHGGQICLPGSIPIILDSVLPRRMEAGAWQYHNMTCYTSVVAGSSVVPVRLNCSPEITRTATTLDPAPTEV
jgi:predicted MPP superfamily phosphohydrolase